MMKDPFQTPWNDPYRVGLQISSGSGAGSSGTPSEGVEAAGRQYGTPGGRISGAKRSGIVQLMMFDDFRVDAL